MEGRPKRRVEARRLEHWSFLARATLVTRPVQQSRLNQVSAEMSPGGKHEGLLSGRVDGLRRF